MPWHSCPREHDFAERPPTIGPVVFIHQDMRMSQKKRSVKEKTLKKQQKKTS
jgi:hypothetical protein